MATGGVQHFPGQDDLRQGLKEDFTEMSDVIDELHETPTLAVTEVMFLRYVFRSVTRFSQDQIAKKNSNTGHDDVEHCVADLEYFMDMERKEKHRAMAGKAEDSRDSRSKERWQNFIPKVLKPYLGKPSESHRSPYRQRDRSTGKDIEAQNPGTKHDSSYQSKLPPIPSTPSSKVGHQLQANAVTHTSHPDDVQGALPLLQEENSVLKFEQPNKSVNKYKNARRSVRRVSRGNILASSWMADSGTSKQPHPPATPKPSHKKQVSGNSTKEEAPERNSESKYSRPPPPADENPRKRSPNLKDQTFKSIHGSQCISRSPDGNEILIGMKQKIIVCDSNGDPYPDRKPISCGGIVFDVAWINYDCFAMVVDESREVENQPPKISLKVVKGVVSGKPTYHPVELPLGAMPRGITRDENFLYVCDVANAESEVVKMSWLHRFKIKDLKSNEGIPLTKESSTELKYRIRPYKVGCNDKYIVITDLNGHVLLIKKSEQGLDTQKSFNAAQIIGKDPGANYGPTGVYCGACNIIMVLSHASKYLAAYVDPEDNMKAIDIHHLDGKHPTGVVVTTGSVSILCIPDNPEK